MSGSIIRSVLRDIMVERKIIRCVNCSWICWKISGKRFFFWVIIINGWLISWLVFEKNVGSRWGKMMNKLIFGCYILGDFFIYCLDLCVKLLVSFYFIGIIFLVNNW